MLGRAIVTILLCAAMGAMPGVEVCAKGKLDILRHDISVKIDPAIHLLEASDYVTIRTTSSGMYAFLIGSNFAIDKLFLDGEKILFDEISQAKLIDYKNEFDADEDFFEGAKGFRFHIADKHKHIFEIHYQGTVYDTLEVPEYSKGTMAEETTGIIGSEGVFLSPETHWYPDRPNEYASFSIKIITPPGCEAVTEGRLIHRQTDSEHTETEWDVSYPTKGLYLTAGKYLMKQIASDGVKIMGYFFPSEEDLLDDYLHASSRYISMYNKLIGPYPFSKFAVVENFFPTGYGMPSYTLLGRRVIRLPFIIHTSLGHEVAHNWWGNCVYVDYDSGNWCEGLTAYIADYRYKEAISDSAAFEYRRTINIDFTSYVNESNDFPLRKFEERTTPASRTIGYGKCAMVFHMLKRMVGEETFYRTLRRFYRDFRFKEASWKDIQTTFERICGRDLESYFDQWVNGTGAPFLTLENASLHNLDDVYRIRAELTQEPAHELLVPFRIEGVDTSCVVDVFVSLLRDTIEFIVDFEPTGLSVDPSHDVFRRLGPLEIPPTISSVLGDEQAIIALPSMANEDTRDAFSSLAEQLSRTGEACVMEDTMITAAEIEKGSVIILGRPGENTIYQLIELPSGVMMSANRFFVGGQDYTETGHSAFITFRNPVNASASICAVLGNSAECIQQSAYKIIHYGKYSYVTFANGKRLHAGVFPVEGSSLSVRF
jgi:hypothetical protein